MRSIELYGRKVIPLVREMLACRTRALESSRARPHDGGTISTARNWPMAFQSQQRHKPNLRIPLLVSQRCLRGLIA